MRTYLPPSALVDGERPFVQLQHRQVAARGVDRADRHAVPVAVLQLRLGEEVEKVLPVSAPRQPIILFRLRKQFLVAVLAKAIDNLCVVVVSIFGMAELVLSDAVDGYDGLDILEPFLGERTVVFTGAEAGCDGAHGDGGPLAAAARVQAVDQASGG